MDTLFWTQCKQNIEFKYTTKKFYGRFLHKLSVYAPAGRLIEKEWENIHEALARRREYAERRVNWGGSWWTNGAKALDADPEFLELLGSIKHHSPNLRFRIEEPKVAIYAATEQELKDLVTKNFKPNQVLYLQEYCGPESAIAEAHLNSGAILRRKDNEYRYKVIIRDGRYSIETKSAMYNYLVNSGETFITNGCKDQLTKDFTYIWNMFFYTNDKDVIHFINLIAPDSIANIHELVVMDNK